MSGYISDSEIFGISPNVLSRVLNRRDVSASNALNAAIASGPAPSVYLTVDRPSGTASEAVSVDNGIYDVLVIGSSGSKQWRRMTTLNGSLTITPPIGETTWKKAVFVLYTEYEPDTKTTLAAALKLAFVPNSLGLPGFGARHAIGSRLTATSISPNNYPSHQGWDVDGSGFVTADTTSLSKRNSSWSITLTNSTPFAGLADAPNHLGDIAVFNGFVYSPVLKYLGSVTNNSAQYVARYNLSTLALVDFKDLRSFGTSLSMSGVGVDTDRKCLVAADYFDNSVIYRMDLETLNMLPPLTISPGSGGNNGIAYRNGRYYLSQLFRNNDTSTMSSGGSVMVLDAVTGFPVEEYVLTDITQQGVQGVAFTSSGQMGVNRTDTNTDRVHFYDLPVKNCWSKTGFVSNSDTYLRFVNMKIPTAFSVLSIDRASALPGSGVTQLWSTSGGLSVSNESLGPTAWIAANGNLIARMTSGQNAVFTGPVAVNTDYTSIFNYDSATGAKSLYVNGTLANSSTDASLPGARASNPDFCAGAGNKDVTPFNGTKKMLMLFNRVLTASEVAGLRADPFSVLRPKVPLTSEWKAVLEASAV